MIVIEKWTPMKKLKHNTHANHLAMTIPWLFFYEKSINFTYIYLTEYLWINEKFILLVYAMVFIFLFNIITVHYFIIFYYNLNRFLRVALKIILSWHIIALTYYIIFPVESSHTILKWWWLITPICFLIQGGILTTYIDSTNSYGTCTIYIHCSFIY